MKIQANRLTVGTKPEIKFVGSGTIMVRFSAAENHNKNVGTREEPEWEQIGTSWYNMVAFGDVASDIVDQLEQGDSFKLIEGFHKWVNLGDEENPDWRANYKITKFEKHVKSQTQEQEDA